MSADSSGLPVAAAAVPAAPPLLLLVLPLLLGPLLLVLLLLAASCEKEGGTGGGDWAHCVLWRLGRLLLLRLLLLLRFVSWSLLPDEKKEEASGGVSRPVLLQPCRKESASTGESPTLWGKLLFSEAFGAPWQLAAGAAGDSVYLQSEEKGPVPLREEATCADLRQRRRAGLHSASLTVAPVVGVAASGPSLQLAVPAGGLRC